MADEAKALVDWLRREVERTGRKGVVFGLSGGLDSALVGCFAQRALGTRALALILPCDSDPRDIRDAERFARKIGLRHETVDLTPVRYLLGICLPAADRAAVANLRARLRMAIVYYYANRLDYLVLGTSNKSELSVGYFTKYGDGAADHLPLAEFYKTELFALARKLELPEYITRKAPSAGLYPGQTDEAEIGVSYGKLDRILAARERNEFASRSPSAVRRAEKTLKLKPDEIRKVTEMVRRSAHKRARPVVFHRSMRKPGRSRQ